MDGRDVLGCQELPGRAGLLPPAASQTRVRRHAGGQHAGIDPLGEAVPDED